MNVGAQTIGGNGGRLTVSVTLLAYPYYLTDALTNDSAVYNLIRQQEEKQGGGFKIPIGVGGAAAGAIVNIRVASRRVLV